MAVLPRRAGLAAVLALTVAGLQPVLAGQALAGTPSAASGTAPSAPTGLAPNTFTSAQKDPVLSWSPVAAATGYQVQLSKSDDWSQASDLVTLPDGGSTSAASYAVPQTLLHGNYFWRVRAVDGSTNGHWSALDAGELNKAWNDAPSITGSTPVADATAPYTSLASAPWRFAWTAMPDASSYEIEFSIYPTFSQPGTTQSGNRNDGTNTLDCLTDHTSFTPYGTYSADTPDVNVDNCNFATFNPKGDTVYWRVRGIDDSDQAAVKPANQPDALECFGAPNTPTGTFPDPAASTIAALGTPTSAGQECSRWSAGGSVAPPVSGDGAVDRSHLGNVGAVSLSCTSCSDTPEISWQPVAHADSYVVTIADDAAFTNVEREYETSLLSLTPRDQLPDYTAGAGYHVAVRACTSDAGDTADNGAGCTASSEATFTKRTAAVSGTTATKLSDGFRLSWHSLSANYAAALTNVGRPAVEAKDYRVQVTGAGDTDFSSPGVDTTVDASCDLTSQTCYAPPAAVTPGNDDLTVSLPDGSYIWRVLPVDLTGNVLPAAYGAGFTVGHPKLHLTTTGAVAVTQPVTFVADKTVTGVDGSSIHLVPSAGGPAVDGTVKTTASPTTWTFTPAAPLVTGQQYVLSVSSAVTDAGGNTALVTGHGITTTTVADNTSKGWTFHGKWSTHTASNAKGHSYVTARSGHRATLQVAGGRVVLFGCKAPTMGALTVTLAGKTYSVSEKQSYTKCGISLWHHTLPAGEQTLTVSVAKAVGSIDEVKVG